jgi:hypothetical protein
MQFDEIRMDEISALTFGKLGPSLLLHWLLIFVSFQHLFHLHSTVTPLHNLVLAMCYLSILLVSLPRQYHRYRETR